MRALFDVNVVIALLDADHVFHDAAHDWWGDHLLHGWASCPLTENGVVRIMAHPGYSQRTRLTPGGLITRLGAFAAGSDHAFWADDLSLRDADAFDVSRIHSPGQLTDLYLLALAARNEGRLVTFDRGIPLSAVRHAREANLCVI